MSRKSNHLPTKTSEKAKPDKAGKTPKVEFELADEEIEDVSGGRASTGFCMPCRTTNA